MLILSGCMTDATLELTKAPFDATTALTDGTSKAAGEFLDPLTKVTSSTTPGAFNGNDLLKARQKTQIFASYSYENLRADIAQGSGENLVSLATLAGITSGSSTLISRPDAQCVFEDVQRKHPSSRIDGSCGGCGLVGWIWKIGSRRH